MTILDGHINFNNPLRIRVREPSDPESEYMPRNIRRDPRYCEAPDVTAKRGARLCNRNTTDKKDRCVTHITQRDYVQEVLDRVRTIEAENTLVFKKGIRHCKPGHNTAMEITQFLKNSGGVMTILGLRKLLQVDIKVARAYVKMLANTGVVSTTKNKRKVMQIKLTELK